MAKISRRDFLKKGSAAMAGMIIQASCQVLFLAKLTDTNLQAISLTFLA